MKLWEEVSPGARRARALAVGALVAAILVTVIVIRGGDDYVVTALFTNASQVVKGADVQVAGRRVGSVQSIELGPHGSAALKLRITDRDVYPLRRGTEAVIRQASLSGVASRYIDLRIPDGTKTAKLAAGSVLPESATQPAVDLDEVFNTLAPREREGLKQIIRGQADSIVDRASQANAGFAYLDPTIAANARLFSELTRNRAELERFVVDSSQLVTTVAQRREQLTGLVDQLANFLSTIAGRRSELDESLRRLPGFLTRSTTTFADLRTTLDVLEPTLQDATPVARRLGPVLAQLRSFAARAKVPVRDLAAALISPGKENDLIDVTRLAVPLRNQLVSSAVRNGARRSGTLPETAKALKGLINGSNALRPYVGDLVGWFDDFGHTGLADANGNAARGAITANAFGNVNGVLTPIPLALRQKLFEGLASLGQDNRCPGAADHAAADRSNVGAPLGVECDPTQTLPGD